jgi:4-hydroxy-tetrahydrodipicolinate reductase
MARIRLIVHGAHGRMGTRICALAERDARFEIVAALDRDDTNEPDAARLGAADVMVDFSSPDGAEHAARLAGAQGVALVVGTTGLSRENARVLGDAARSIPVLIAPNTSLGVAVMSHLAGEAARRLGEAFDVDIIEAHHTHKRDAPSGTALRLAAAIGTRAGREMPPERTHAIRAGDTVGEHTILFSGQGENLSISHVVRDRDVFAAGALHAAAWLAGREPGRYSMEDALGLTR